MLTETGIRRGLLLVLVLGSAHGADAQTLPLKERPEPTSVLCEPGPAETAVATADPAEKERLVNAATQAMILGDLSVAAEFLDQALEADPGAAEPAYLRGRIAMETGDVAAAVPWFCRYLAIAPSGASAAESRRRLQVAVEQGVGAEVFASFAGAVSRFEAGQLEEAEQLFTSVLDRHAVPEAVYNRGVVRVALERSTEARTDLARYLELRPDAGDRAVVSQALQLLAQETRRPGVGAAFALGSIFPGGGQFYTGRPRLGILVTGLAGGAAAAGYLYQETTILCRAPAPSGECPPEAIASQTTERPYLMPALGAAAGIMLLTALEAALNAANTPEIEVPIGNRATVGLGPSVLDLGHNVIDISFIRLGH